MAVQHPAHERHLLTSGTFGPTSEFSGAANGRELCRRLNALRDKANHTSHASFAADIEPVGLEASDQLFG
jgi:hypothetical protein